MCGAALAVLAAACRDGGPGAPPTEIPSGPEAVVVTDQCTLPGLPAPADVLFLTGVPYYQPEGSAPVLDIVWPRAAPVGKYPLVVFVHGGAWREGGPSLLFEDAARIAGQGFVAASVGYRFAPETRYPGPVNDLRCALRFLASTAANVGADPSRVVLIGVSAGAQLVTLLAAAENDPTLDVACPHAAPPPRIAGVVGISGPYDLRLSSVYPAGVRSTIFDFLGDAPESVPQIAAAASPVARVTAMMAPTLLVHGSLDNLVPVAIAREMLAALRTATVPSTFVELPTVVHDVTPFDPAVDRRRASCTIYTFVRARLAST